MACPADPSPPPTAQLRIEPGGWCVPLPPGLSLLEAAQAQGVRLARSCRNGSCRACLCELREGAVRYRIDWPGLSTEERDQGWVLPCVAEALGDVRLHAPQATGPQAPAPFSPTPSGGSFPP